ncbi:MAG TPA: glycosyltransferase family 4 protein [Thermoplasmata archaeon]
MPRWRIDFLASVPPEETSSGLGRGVWGLSGALVSLGHRVRVLYPADPPRAHAPYLGVEAVPVPTAGASRRPFGRDIAFGRRATALIEPTTDLLIGNDEKAGALGTVPSTRKDRPVFGFMAHDVALHTFDTLRPLEPDRGLRQRVGNWLDRRALKGLEGQALARARAVLVGSSLNAELLERYYRIPKNRIHHLPHGVPDPVAVGTKAEARLALKVPPDVPVVAFVGRTPERQGLPVALAAFRKVRVFFPGARFLVAGSTPKSEPGVVPLGLVDEMTKARVFTAADVFIFPAKYEGFGLAPREAMRYGLATIVSSQVPLEGIEPSEACRVVASEDPADYASELAELLADPALRRSLGEAARTLADAMSYDRMAERFERIFAPIVGPSDG